MATAASKAAGIKNLKEAWKGPKDFPGLTWDEALAAFLQSRQLGINGAQHAVRPRTNNHGNGAAVGCVPSVP
jgi:hypothetical protein